MPAEPHPAPGLIGEERRARRRSAEEARRRWRGRRPEATVLVSGVGGSLGRNGRRRFQDRAGRRATSDPKYEAGSNQAEQTGAQKCELVVAEDGSDRARGECDRSSSKLMRGED